MGWRLLRWLRRRSVWISACDFCRLRLRSQFVSSLLVQSHLSHLLRRSGLLLSDGNLLLPLPLLLLGLLLLLPQDLLLLCHIPGPLELLLLCWGQNQDHELYKIFSNQAALLGVPLEEPAELVNGRQEWPDAFVVVVEGRKNSSDLCLTPVLR